MPPSFASALKFGFLQSMAVNQSGLRSDGTLLRAGLYLVWDFGQNLIRRRAYIEQVEVRS